MSVTLRHAIKINGSRERVYKALTDIDEMAAWHQGTTEGNIAVGFYTNDGSGWSENWLGQELMPGASARAEFPADTRNCDQVFQIGWLGSDDSEVLDEPISIDICDASNVYLDDNEIYYD